MKIDASKENFEHVDLFGLPALFTNYRIDRDTVPTKWHCYDIRGSDYDCGALIFLETRVLVNHAGAILCPKPILFPKDKDYRCIRGQINFIGEKLSLEEFCEVHKLSYPK